MFLDEAGNEALSLLDGLEPELLDTIFEEEVSEEELFEAAVLVIFEEFGGGGQPSSRNVRRLAALLRRTPLMQTLCGPRSGL